MKRINFILLIVLVLTLTSCKDKDISMKDYKVSRVSECIEDCFTNPDDVRESLLLLHTGVNEFLDENNAITDTCLNKTIIDRECFDINSGKLDYQFLLTLSDLTKDADYNLIVKENGDFVINHTTFNRPSYFNEEVTTTTEYVIETNGDSFKFSYNNLVSIISISDGIKYETRMNNFDEFNKLSSSSLRVFNDGEEIEYSIRYKDDVVSSYSYFYSNGSFYFGMNYDVESKSTMNVLLKNDKFYFHNDRENGMSSLGFYNETYSAQIVYSDDMNGDNITYIYVLASKFDGWDQYDLYNDQILLDGVEVESFAEYDDGNNIIPVDPGFYPTSTRDYSIDMVTEQGPRLGFRVGDDQLEAINAINDAVSGDIIIVPDFQTELEEFINNPDKIFSESGIDFEIDVEYIKDILGIE